MFQVSAASDLRGQQLHASGVLEQVSQLVAQYVFDFLPGAQPAKGDFNLPPGVKETDGAAVVPVLRFVD